MKGISIAVFSEYTAEMAGVVWILLWTEEEPKGLPRAALLCSYGKIVNKTMQSIEGIKKMKWG